MPRIVIPAKAGIYGDADSSFRWNDTESDTGTTI